MGLKTTNYRLKKNKKVVMEQAYAIIENLFIKGEYARADFVIQSGRVLEEGEEPLERISVEFALNRNESPFITAYKTAKGQHYENRYNEETDKVEKVIVNNSVFYDWENDIV
jgi:hypothetical protein